MRKKDKLSASDAKLFRDSMQNVNPLEQNKVLLKSSKPIPRKTSKEPPPGLDSLPLVSPADPLNFSRPGFSPKIFKKLKQGQFDIEDTLDLHGMTVSEARAALTEFLDECFQEDALCVSIIHGKGRKSGSPILKNKINEWLREDPNILAFCSAKPHHGGTGAVYVLLQGIKT